MSFEPDNIESELTIKELLQLVLDELRLIKMHNEQITDQVFKSEDIDE